MLARPNVSRDTLKGQGKFRPVLQMGIVNGERSGTRPGVINLCSEDGIGAISLMYDHATILSGKSNVEVVVRAQHIPFVMHTLLLWCRSDTAHDQCLPCTAIFSRPMS